MLHLKLVTVDAFCHGVAPCDGTVSKLIFIFSKLVILIKRFVLKYCQQFNQVMKIKNTTVTLTNL